MKSNPLVSIIIPTYNTGSTIRASLESALAQTYSPIEIIVVDDGSTDDTAAILQPFLAQITYVHQQNEGVSAARNHGLRLARGELIVFLDADDLLMPGKISKQAALFDGNPKLGIVNSGWQTIDEDGNPLDDITPWVDAPKLDLHTWLFWKPVFPAAMMFRKTWVEKTGGFDPALTHAEDVDLTLRVMALGCRAMWLEEITAEYRQRAGSAARQWHRQIDAIIIVLDKFFALPGLPRKVRRSQNSARFHTLLWYIWQLFRQDPQNEAIAGYLRRSRDYAGHPMHVMLFYWLTQLAAWTPIEYETFKAACGYFLNALDDPLHIPIVGTQTIRPLKLFNWWLHNDDASDTLADFPDLTRSMRRELLQVAALTSADFIPPEHLRASLRAEFVPADLTLARRALFSGKPRIFLSRLRAALRGSLSISGLLAWPYWIRSTTAYWRGRP
jgi:glycosyltransferase involved in cell wall biosynthesis